MEEEILQTTDRSQNGDNVVLQEKISELAPKMSVRIAPDTPVKDVIELMVSKKASAILVVEENKLLGIFSERDIVNKIATRFDAIANDPISKYMTKDPEVLSENHTLAFALNRMSEGDYRHIPVTDDQGSPAGLISLRDILRFIDNRWLNGSPY